MQPPRQACSKLCGQLCASSPATYLLLVGSHPGKHWTASSARVGSIDLREPIRSTVWRTQANAQVTNFIVKASENAEQNEIAKRNAATSRNSKVRKTCELSLDFTRQWCTPLDLCVSSLRGPNGFCRGVDCTRHGVRKYQYASSEV